ncbi:MAG: hypothetical protein RDV48_13910 [Candidatus Eremiobacteraeota bacterium]|nr:hypothetical protein [Candidatus Eremiobacteraeota bacterium]
MDEAKKIELRVRWWFHLAVFIILVILSFTYYTKTEPRGALDYTFPFGPLEYAILPFHEAGHFIFAIFGDFWGALGGTIVQFGLPLAFSLYFFLARKDHFAGGAAAFWFFSQFFGVSVYMRDARFMILPLFGGGEHDWNYLFGQLHLLNKSVQIADAMRITGLLGITADLLFLVFLLVRDRSGEAFRKEPQDG